MRYDKTHCMICNKGIDKSSENFLIITTKGKVNVETGINDLAYEKRSYICEFCRNDLEIWLDVHRNFVGERTKWVAFNEKHMI